MKKKQRELDPEKKSDRDHEKKQRGLDFEKKSDRD
jgi:hypothetical protein